MALVPDPLPLNAMYFSPTAGSYLKDLTETSSSLTLPKGQYFMYLASTSIQGASLKYGGAAVAPTDGGTVKAATSVLPPGAVCTVVLTAETVMHGIMNAASATGKLWITKVRG